MRVSKALHCMTHYEDQLEVVNESPLDGIAVFLVVVFGRPSFNERLSNETVDRRQSRRR